MPHGIVLPSTRLHPAKDSFILATPEGCDAGLTWMVVTSRESLLAKDGHISQKLPGSVMAENQTHDREPSDLTPKPPSHPSHSKKGKVFPYSLPSVIDPCVQAVSPQVTISHLPVVGCHYFMPDLRFTFVSVHQMAPHLTEVTDIQFQLTTHLSTSKG